MFNYLALPKNPQLKQKARKLRKSGVLSEVLFWQTFKDKQKLGWDIEGNLKRLSYPAKKCPTVSSIIGNHKLVPLCI